MHTNVRFLDEKTYIVEHGNYYIQKLSTYNANSAPELLNISGEVIQTIKIGWWGAYVKTGMIIFLQ
jgi:hypothetical protein